jgi:hypothetical protein
MAAVDAAGVLDPNWHPLVADDRVRMLRMSPDSASIYVGGEFPLDRRRHHPEEPGEASPTPVRRSRGSCTPATRCSGSASGPTLFAGGNGSGGHVGAFGRRHLGPGCGTLQTDGGVQAVTVIDNTLRVVP